MKLLLSEIHFLIPRSLFFICIIMLLPFARSAAQDKYILGEDQRLEIVVFIMGEVKKPGKYIVLDGTNIIELLSEAGGATEFANLDKVTITHSIGNQNSAGSRAGNTDRLKRRITRYNVNDYLKKNEFGAAPPVLAPSDVILVPNNTWRSWRRVATIVRDFAVVTSAYFLYRRAVKD